MAEKNENQKETLMLDKIKELKSGEIESLKKGYADLRKNIGDVLKKLDEKGKDYLRLKKEREETEEKRLAEEKEQAKANEAARLEAERIAAENAKREAENAKREAEERAKAEELARKAAASKAKYPVDYTLTREIRRYRLL